MAETVIDTEAHLREGQRAPSHRAANKEIDHIDPLAERFIAATPFITIASQRKDGGLDVSPRGDPAGFMKVLDPKTLAIPDRPGNRRMDTHVNLLTNPEVAIMCMIPGNNDVLRIGGRARMVSDPDLAASMVVNGHTPSLILLVSVDRLMCHCPKAMMRCGIWEPDKWPDTQDVPTLGQMVKAHGALADSIEQINGDLANDYRTNFY
ncbi:MAG: MSMEG_1061 family FMN-dependent PPOX-type flavoprotein [Pseudomonadota bacterium]